MRGIMFIEFLFGRTLAGFKDMTRRAGGLDWVNGTKKEPKNPDESRISELFPKSFHDGRLVVHFEKESRPGLITVGACVSGYKVGEYLYLKEPTMIIHNNLRYKYQPTDVVAADGWDNKMFMGRDRARYFIEITGISIDRLNDISTEDCIREGVAKVQWDRKSNNVYKFKRITEKEQFFSIYRTANNISPKKVLPNIWLFVYTFELITDPEVIKNLKEYGKP